ncbi:alpha/beta fold hydrolase [Actinomadura bangladeshensis]|uniref:Alpha/beta fold hydrolase n=1 Tax=Actinomadura bangladeshensis TaxID=453573 RepID=A0A6L9QTP7_9ACTN|nr:alpha/beta fold hydrolase [Actinomadura bangladeshensis]
MSAVDLAFTDEGHGDVPVLLAASLGTTGAMWAPQRERLSRSRRVVAFDHRGHGGSPSPAGPYSMDDLVADTVALLDRLDVASADVVGVSLGGTVGLALALAHPERVRTLTTVNAPVFADDPGFWHRREDAVLADGMSVATSGLLGRWYSPAVAAAPSVLVADTVTAVDKIDPVGYAGCCAAIAGTDLRPRLAELRRPVLAVTGGADAVIPAHHAELIASRVPGARLAVLPDAGHLLPQEDPDGLHELLAEHWESAGRDEVSAS